MNTPNSRVLLLTLSQRVSAKGNLYWSGWLGRASVVGFPGEPDRFGNATVDLFVSEPQPKAGEGKPVASASPPPASREGYAGGARQRTEPGKFPIYPIAPPAGVAAPTASRARRPPPGLSRSST